MAFLDTDIFAKIINKEIPATIIYESDEIIAFNDIAPKAKTHVLIVPKANIKTAKEVCSDNLNLFGKLFLVAKEVAEKEGLKGYKLHMNVDEEGGQIVPHVHLHLLSGEFKTNL